MIAEGLTEKKLQRLYLKERKTISEIAKLYNCSLTTVRSRLMKAGVLKIKTKAALKKRSYI